MSKPKELIEMCKGGRIDCQGGYIVANGTQIKPCPRCHPEVYGLKNK
jgi:hypothetical protein